MANDCGWPGVGFGGPPAGWQSPCADVKSGVQAPGPDDGMGGLSSPSLWGGDSKAAPTDTAPSNDDSPAAPPGDRSDISGGDGDGGDGGVDTGAMTASLGGGGDDNTPTTA